MLVGSDSSAATGLVGARPAVDATSFGRHGYEADKRENAAILCVCVCVCVSSSAVGGIIYVDEDSICTSTCGGSWEDAYSSLQDALGAATSGDDIWVAAGEYKPHPSDRTVAFQLKAGVALYGGFVGTETQREQRNWTMYASILTGDLDDDHDEQLPDTDDSIHIVAGKGASTGTPIAVLDGFVIAYSYADATDFGWNGSGGGYVSCGGSGDYACGTPADDAPTIRNCTFRNNYAAGSGGAMNLKAPSTIENCTFDANEVTGHTGNGHAGALYCNDDSTVIKNCVFKNNKATNWGGAVTVGDAVATFYNCLFHDNATTDNSTIDGGGGAMLLAARNNELTKIINCTFVNNEANVGQEGAVGGGILIVNTHTGSYDGPTVDIDNCIFRGNTDGTENATDIKQVTRVSGYGALSVQYSAIEGCADAGGTYCASPGDHNIGHDPRFEEPEADNYRLLRSSPCIDAGNNAVAEGPDLDGNTRLRDLHCMPDAGAGGAPVVDMGPYEFQEGSVVYVDADAPGNDDGSSWEHAYTDLQDALLDAQSTGSICEIRVADGTYKPTTDSNRAKSFELVEGASLYGGYVGYGGADPDYRNPGQFETILSGNIDGSGDDDSYNVVTGGAYIYWNTELDGFTIKKGRADGASDPQRHGGGIYLGGYGEGPASASPTIRNCTIEHNVADRNGDDGANGGGVYCGQGSTAIFESCVFQNNEAFNLGGAVFTAAAAPSFTDCEFISNAAVGEEDGGDGWGGAVTIGTGASPPVTFLRCSFRHNTASQNGGALTAHTGVGGTIVMTNCLFYRNTAGTWEEYQSAKGGAIWTERPLDLTNCTFANNDAAEADGGGAIYHNVHSPNKSQLRNCVLWRNRGDGERQDEEDQILIELVNGQGGVEAWYSCIENIDALNEVDHFNTGEDPLYKDQQGDDYELNPVACGDESCTSESIDLGEDEYIDDTTDVRKSGRARKVNLDNRTDLVDMGCLETQAYNP